MSLVDVVLPSTAAQAAHGSSANSAKGAEGSATQGNRAALTQSLPSQSATVVSLSSNSKSRTTSSRPNEKVDPNFGSESSRKQASNKDKEETGKKLNITA